MATFRGPAGAQNNARDPAGAQNNARGPAGAQNNVRGPAGAQNNARDPAGAQNNVFPGVLTQQSLEMVFHLAVAFARRLLQSGPIEYRDLAAAIADQPRLLQRLENLRDADAANA